MYKEIEITVNKMSNETHRIHKHHFFELIYILEGQGRHLINDNQYEFNRHDVFFLTPGDSHAFDVKESCEYCIIDFTASFFSKSSARINEKMDISDFFKKLEFIFHNHHNVHGSLITQDDKPVFEVLIHKLIIEKDASGFYSDIITQNILFLLLNILAGNIYNTMQQQSGRTDVKNKVHDIIAYIQLHIYDKELLKIENLADQFGRSTDHLNRYFKSITNSTIKQYILKHKLELILTRLKFSDLTIGEIAYEMDLTDESHLNKIFKKEYGITASQYRNQARNEDL